MIKNKPRKNKKTFNVLEGWDLKGWNQWKKYSNNTCPGQMVKLKCNVNGWIRKNRL